MQRLECLKVPKTLIKSYMTVILSFRQILPIYCRVSFTHCSYNIRILLILLCISVRQSKQIPHNIREITSHFTGHYIKLTDARTSSFPSILSFNTFSILLQVQ